MNTIRIFLISSLFLSLGNSLSAQEIGGAEILGTVDTIGNRLNVELNLITNCYSQHPVFATLYLKCENTGSLLDSITMTMNSPVDISGFCSNQCTHCSNLNCSYPYGYRKYKYSGFFDISGISNCQEVVVYYQNYTRSSTITTGSASSDFYIESRFSLQNTLGYWGFTDLPKSMLCRNQDYFENVSLLNANFLDSVVYELASPKESSTKGVPYSASYSYDKPLSFWGFPNAALTYPRGFHLDNLTGDFYFRPVKSQETPIAIKTSIYNDGEFVAEINREWILNVISCNSNYVPNLSGPFYKKVCSYTPYQFTISANDYDLGDSLLFDNSQQIEKGYKVISEDYSKPNNPKLTIEVEPFNIDKSTSHLYTITVKDNKCPIQGAYTRAFQFELIEGVIATTIINDSNCGLYYFNLKDIKGDLSSIKWMMDSKVISSDTSFYHQFFTEDTFYYSVELTASNGCKYFYADEIITSITRPIVDAGVDDTVCYKDSLFHLKGSPFPSVGSWDGDGVIEKDNQWYFDPSASGLLANTFHELIYTYTDSNACSNSDTLQIFLLETSIPDAGDSSVLCENAGLTQLVGIPSNGKWTGAGVVNGKFDPSIGYGNYLLSYEVSTNGQCPNYDTLKMFVAPLPEINFSASPINGNIPLLVEFTDSSMIQSGSISSYYWNFGDGDTSNHFGSVSHTYTSAGLFSIILFCESDFGCKEFAVKSNFVNPWPVSVREYLEDNLNIYPNPASKEVYIEAKQSSIKSLVLYDLSGKILIEHYNLSAKEFIIENNELNGTYLLKVVFQSNEVISIPIIFN